MGESDDDEIRCACGKVYRAASLMRGQRVPCLACGRTIGRDAEPSPPRRLTLDPPSHALEQLAAAADAATADEVPIVVADPAPAADEADDDRLPAIPVSAQAYLGMIPASVASLPRAVPLPAPTAWRPASTSVRAGDAPAAGHRACCIVLASIGILFAGGIVLAAYLIWIPNELVFNYYKLWKAAHEVQLEIGDVDRSSMVYRFFIPPVAVIAGFVLGFVSLKYAANLADGAKLGDGAVRSIQRAALLMAIAWVGWIAYDLHKHGLYKEINFGSFHARYIRSNTVTYPLPVAGALLAAAMAGALGYGRREPTVSPARSLHATYLIAGSAIVLLLVVHLTDPMSDVRRQLKTLELKLREFQERVRQDAIPSAPPSIPQQP